jgi:hypothetical protein
MRYASCNSMRRSQLFHGVRGGPQSAFRTTIVDDSRMPCTHLVDCDECLRFVDILSGHHHGGLMYVIVRMGIALLNRCA